MGREICRKHFCKYIFDSFVSTGGNRNYLECFEGSENDRWIIIYFPLLRNAKRIVASFFKRNNNVHGLSITVPHPGQFHSGASSRYVLYSILERSPCFLLALQFTFPRSREYKLV